MIGGSPCAGKSTLSQYLADLLEYQFIRVDDFMMEHIKKANGEDHPIMYQWQTKPWYELFSRPVSIQLKEEVEFYKEEWPMLKKDIYKLVKREGVIIEGCALLPSLVKELYPKAKIIYMVPTEAFQKEKYKLRQWAFDLLKDAVSPQEAFNRWMDRDVGFAKYIKVNANNEGYPVIVMDGSESTEILAQRLIKL